jgi:hypothetical protein
VVPPDVREGYCLVSGQWPSAVPAAREARSSSPACEVESTEAIQPPVSTDAVHSHLASNKMGKRKVEVEEQAEDETAEPVICITRCLYCSSWTSAPLPLDQARAEYQAHARVAQRPEDRLGAGRAP